MGTGKNLFGILLCDFHGDGDVIKPSASCHPLTNVTTQPTPASINRNDFATDRSPWLHRSRRSDHHHPFGQSRLGSWRPAVLTGSIGIARIRARTFGAVLSVNAIYSRRTLTTYSDVHRTNLGPTAATTHHRHRWYLTHVNRQHQTNYCLLRQSR